MLIRLALTALSLLAPDPTPADDARVLASPQSPAIVSYIPPPAPIAAPGDPYGFGPWLNAHRAMRGLHSLAFDPGLAGLAAANSSRGFGHHGHNPGRENVGMGSLGQVESGWLHSAAHAAALFDRGATRYGIALVNGVWTYNAR